MATKETVELRVKLDDKASRQLKDIDKALKGLNGRMGGLTTSSGAAAGALGGLSGRLSMAKVGLAAVAVGAVAVTKAILDNARAYESVTNQLRLVTKDQDDYNETIARLTKLSKENLSDFGATVDLYTKLKVATDEMGFSNEKVEELTSKFSKALVVAGADAGTAAGVIRQFGQAMQSGSVRGDEFISITEGLGTALAIMAKESNMTIGQLREMSQNGELTAEVFADMLLNSKNLDAAFGKLDPTMDQLNGQLSNSITRLSFAVAEFLGLDEAARALAIGITNVADAISDAAEGPTPLEKLETQLIAAKAELIGIAPEIEKVSTIMERFDTGVMSNSDTIDRFVNKIEDQNRTFKVANPLYDAQIALIKELEAQIAKLTETQTEQKEVVEDVAAAEEKHRKELLATIFNYSGILDPLKEYKNEEQKLQEQLDKTVYAMHLYNRAFALGINRVGAGGQATRVYKEETALLSAEIERLYQELEELAMAAAIAENPYIGLVNRHKELKEEATMLIGQMAEVALQLGENDDKTGALAFAYESLKEQLAGVNAELGKFGDMTVGMLDSQIQKTLEAKEANQALLEEYIKQGASTLELAEAYRILGLEIPEVLQSYEDYVKEMKENAKVTDNNIANQRQYMQVLQAQKRATDDLTEAQKKQLATLEALFEETKNEGFNLAEAIGKAMSQAVTSVSGSLADMMLGLGNGFSDLEDIALNAIRNIIAALIEAQIQKALFGAAGGAAGAAGGLLGGLGALGASTLIPGLGLLAGAGMLIGGFFEKGGNVASGRKPIVVGEKGPELFLPGRSGSVVSNQDMEGVSGGESLTVNFNLNAIDTQTGTEFLVQNKRVITGVVQDAFRRRAQSGPLG